MANIKLKNIDICARIFSFIRDIEKHIIHVFCTLWMRFKCFFMGVELGEGVSFNGLAHIERFKHSTIALGNKVTINSNIHFNPRGISKCVLQTGTDHARIEIGDNSGISGVSIVSNESVVIGKNVNIGAGTVIGDRDDHHEIFGNNDAPIRIEDNVFIGMKCIILKGVTIGRGAIIGAGSIVTRNIPENAVAVGNPCKVIRQKEDK